MHLAVLGASGGVGRHLAREAVSRGHTVRAVVRDGSKLDVPESVEVVRGDLTSESFLRGAVRGQGAVLSGLGLRLPGLGPWNQPEQPEFLDRSTAALVSAMKAEGVRRIVVVSAGGVGDSYDAMPGVFKAFIKTTSLRRVYPALGRMETALLSSGLDVCVARPTGLTDGPASGRVKVTTRVVGRASIARADVAAWMLDQLTTERFEHRTALITETGAE